MQGRWKKCYKSLLTHWIATDYSKIVINNFKIQIKIQVCAGIGIFLSSNCWIECLIFFFMFKFVDIKVRKSTYQYMNLHVLIFRLFCMCYTRYIYMLYKACKTVFKIIFLYNPFVLWYIYFAYLTVICLKFIKTMTLCVVDKLCYHRFC